LSEEDWAEIDGKIDQFRDPLATVGNLRFGLIHERTSAHQHLHAS
jgi:hypothetical protein